MSVCTFLFCISCNAYRWFKLLVLFSNENTERIFAQLFYGFLLWVTQKSDSVWAHNNSHHSQPAAAGTPLRGAHVLNVRPLGAGDKMFEVKVNNSSLKNSDYGTISGQIFIKGPVGYFPVEGWFDFPVVILGWWLQGLSEIASGKVRSFEAVFMDGPYSFVVDSVSDAIAQVAWKDRGCLSIVGTINILVLLDSIVEASNQILGVCRAKSWQNSDIENLERTVFGALPYLLTQN